MTNIHEVTNTVVKKVPAATVTAVVLILAFGYFLTSTNLNTPLIKMLEATTVASNEQTESVKKLSVDIRELARVVSEGNKRIDSLEAKVDRSSAILERRVTMLEDIVIHKRTDNAK